MLTLPKWLMDQMTVAVTCWQFGDTGKGKLVDLLACYWADIIARGTGADNAGHTIVLGEKKYIMHLIPCGILHDKDGKINVIGSGVAVNPRVVLEEIGFLEENGCSYDHLKIALNAKLTMPYHILLDRLRESGGSGKIGTTGRGVGPVYTDHTARCGLIVNDMLNPEIFRRKLEKNIREKLIVIRQYDDKKIKEIMNHEHLLKGRFYGGAVGVFDVEAIVDYYVECGKKLRAMICDTDKLLREAVGKKKILLEGAQGLNLSVDHGAHPYVTSSDCTLDGLAKGVGLHESQVDMELGICKAFYMTRVGGGPFPTELGGTKAEKWCGTDGVSKSNEITIYPHATVNSEDEFIQGVGFRVAGAEYGATTGRPRRCGWLDLPILRYAMAVTGRQDIVLTKLDVLDACETIKICKHYLYCGDPYEYGDTTLEDGSILMEAIPDVEVMKYCLPVYEEFPGWLTSIREAKSFEELPQELVRIVEYVEQTGACVRVLSVGPDREETIFR